MYNCIKLLQDRHFIYLKHYVHKPLLLVVCYFLQTGKQHTCEIDEIEKKMKSNLQSRSKCQNYYQLSI